MVRQLGGAAFAVALAGCGGSDGYTVPEGEYGLIELAVLSGEVGVADLPGAEARALLALAVDDDGVWSGQITFIDGGLIALADVEGWTGPWQLEGGCTDGDCVFTYGDPDAEDASNGTTDPTIALRVTASLQETAVEGSLEEVLRIGGIRTGTAELSMSGFIVGPPSFDDAVIPASVVRNGDCGPWSGQGAEVEIVLDSTGRGTLAEESGLLGDTDDGGLPAMASGSRFYAFRAREELTGQAGTGAECLDQEAWWADLEVRDGSVTGSISYRWRYGPAEGEFDCDEAPVDCTAVYVLDAP